MSKYAFLIYHKEYEGFLSYLQSLGVVHIDQKVKAQEEGELKEYQEDRSRITSLIRQLKAWLPEQVVPTQEEERANPKVIQETEQVFAELDLRQETVERIETQIKEQEVWGEFSPEQITTLASKGYTIKAYAIAAQLFTEEYIDKYQCVAIEKLGATQYFVRLETVDCQPCPDAEQRVLPTKRLSLLQEELKTAQNHLTQWEDSLRELAPSRITQLEMWDTLLSGSIQYETARQQGQAEADNMLIYLEGWIPSEKAQALEGALTEGGYYFCQTEIQEEDRVPISLSNNMFARGFELISKMYALPSYNEFDQTALFAPFFMLFFGLCMGDAAYGLLILIIATYFKYKLPKGEDDTVYLLLQWLGGAAFIVGLLVGSFFAVTLPYATSKDYFLNQDNLMALSIVLGVLQIFFAKGVAAYKTQVQRGLKFALAPYSWIIFLLGMGAMFGLPALGINLPSMLIYILYGLVGLSGLIILLYNTPGSNPLINVGSGLWAAYNNASGLIGDILSYIRLFAIGLTGAVLGSVFNTLAIDQTESLNAFVRFPLMLFILLVGHAINIGLALIGALVHPIRLTYVEFFKNSEFEGGGIEYNPLRGKVITEK